MPAHRPGLGPRRLIGQSLQQHVRVRLQPQHLTQLGRLLDFIDNKTEWTGTDITFDIAKKGTGTEVRFTHVGLVPDYECFDNCSSAWNLYIASSLRSLITNGQGQPNPKEGDAS